MTDPTDASAHATARGDVGAVIGDEGRWALVEGTGALPVVVAPVEPSSRRPRGGTRRGSAATPRAARPVPRRGQASGGSRVTEDERPDTARATLARLTAAASASTARAAASARRPPTARRAAAEPSRSELVEARPRAATRGRGGPAPSGARTAHARASSRPGGPSGPGRQQPPRNRIEPAQARGSWVSAVSWRLAVLIGVVVLAAAVVLPSLRVYFRQQEELAGLRADAQQAQQELDDLQGEAARWDDPAFVVAQARERLAYVFPGETPYRVIDPETVTGAVEGSPAAEESAQIEPEGTWYTRLWGSIDEAGTASVGAVGSTPEGTTAGG